MKRMKHWVFKTYLIRGKVNPDIGKSYSKSFGSISAKWLHNGKEVLRLSDRVVEVNQVPGGVVKAEISVIFMITTGT